MIISTEWHRLTLAGIENIKETFQATKIASQADDIINHLMNSEKSRGLIIAAGHTYVRLLVETQDQPLQK
jgi:hypothetical protein